MLRARKLGNEKYEAQSMHSLIVPVMISHADNPNIQLKTYALLDNQSNSCFGSDNLIKKLAASTADVKLRLITALKAKHHKQ